MPLLGLDVSDPPDDPARSVAKARECGRDDSDPTPDRLENGLGNRPGDTPLSRAHGTARARGPSPLRPTGQAAPDSAG